MLIIFFLPNFINIVQNNFKLSFNFNLIELIKIILNDKKMIMGILLLEILFILLITYYKYNFKVKNSHSTNGIPEHVSSNEFGSSKFASIKEIKDNFTTWKFGKENKSGGMVDAIESVIYKLDLKEQQKLNITLEKIRSIVIYSADEKRNIKIDKEDLQKKYNIISRAIQEQNILTFKFHNKERRFQPFSFTYYKDFIYITGYSIDENDIKTLNLSGIDDLKM